MDKENPLTPGMDPLFSIDVSAHLAKVSSRYFCSPDHYAVELVRLALRRGARKVEVKCDARQLLIVDDGPAPDPSVFERMTQLTDADAWTGKREEIIAGFLDEQGIGWLSLFAPRPQKIECAFPGHKWTFGEGRWVREAVSSREEARTRLQVFRRSESWQNEEALIREFCCFAGQRVQVNGKGLEESSAMDDSLAAIHLPAQGDSPGGRLWLPRSGNLCKVWLLDHGVVWKRSLLATWKGMVFAAAMECGRAAESLLLERLEEPLRRLYSWLTEQYGRCPSWAKQRVEELLFIHFRSTNDPDFIERIAPFRRLAPPAMLSLREVRQLEPIAVVPAGEDEKDFSRPFPIPTLALTREQWDFLANSAGIRLFAVPRKREAGRASQRMANIWRKPLRFFSHALTRGFILVFGDRASTLGRGAECRNFVSAIHEYFERFPPGSPLSSAPEMVWVNWPGFSPLRRLQRKNRMVVYLRRNHPMVRRAMAMMGQDERNVEMIASWLVSSWIALPTASMLQ